MEFGVLGPLQVTDGDREIEIPAGRQRSLLAALLLRANQVVATDQLVAQIWDDRPPRDSRATAQTYIRRLRGILGSGRIETAPGGYLIAVAPDRLDLTRFDELVRQARASGDPGRQADLLARALRLFPVLAERRSQLAGTLSGGEQQMLAIARGLMAGPRLLLIDEASLGLSPKLVGEVFAAIRQINADGVTVLMVEQNAGVLAGVDRAFVLQKGRVVNAFARGESLHETLRVAYFGDAVS